MASAVQSAIVLREELSPSSRFRRLSAIQSLTVVVTVGPRFRGRLAVRTRAMSTTAFRLITLITSVFIDSKTNDLNRLLPGMSIFTA